MFSYNESNNKILHFYNYNKFVTFTTMLNGPALLLPLRFVDTSNRNSSFDGNFANEQVPQWKMGEKCYLQKFQRSDKLLLQWISDEPLTDLNIIDEIGNISESIPWTASDLTLKGYPDFIIYEIEYNLNLLQEGIYVIQQDEWEAQAIDIRNEHPNTVLIEYSNSENDKDVVFETGIVFQFRTEGGIGNYVPKNQRDVYINQVYNPTQLKSIAHRQFTLYIGFQDGVPEWVLDKANIITQCDEVFYDNVQYQPISDSEFEVIRADDITTFVGGTIDVEPTNNFIKFETGNNPEEQTVRIVRRTHELLNISGSQSVVGVFKQASKLQEVVVYKSGIDFTLKIGTTPNGNEIGEFLIDVNNGATEFVNFAFGAPTTVYLSGAGLNADSIYLVYDQMDAPEIPLNQSASDELGKGATTLWTGSQTEFNDAFDMVTGLGKSNTKWAKWTIAGRNGTRDYNSAYPVGIDVSKIGQDYTSLFTEVGANEKLIPKNSLPAEGINMFSAGVGTIPPSPPVTGNDTIASAGASGSSSYNYQIARGAGAATLGKSANLGNGDNFNVQPKSVISLYVTKLID